MQRELRAAYGRVQNNEAPGADLAYNTTGVGVLTEDLHRRGERTWTSALATHGEVGAQWNNEDHNADPLGHSTRRP
eukprot:2814686-Lingulodinium_polyedra.AAC.1